jgi:hypothetical protein
MVLSFRPHANHADGGRFEVALLDMDLGEAGRLMNCVSGI